MQKKIAPYPGKISVVFRKGPLGYLLQDPSKEARRIKNDPKLQDKSAPMREDLVRQNALTVVYQRGGDASDMKEVQGEYILQFGKYKGKSFRWLLENDVGYTMYLIKDLQKEEAAGTSVEEGHGKESLHSFVQYALSFTEIKTLLDYEASRVSVAAEACEDDQLVGFGSRAKSTWKEIWDSRGDGYADFIMRKSCSQGTRMHKLQQYLRKKQQSASASTNAPTKPLGMDEDKDLEDAMLSISPVKLHMQSFTVPAAAEGSTPRGSSGANTVPSAALSIPPSSTTAEPQASSADGAASGVTRKSPVPLPQELAFLLKETTGPSTDAASTSVRKVLTFEDSSEDAPSAQPAVPVPVADYEHDLSSWNCSPHQKLWMKTELQDLGLWPGSRPVRHAGNAISLWRLPPQPELIDTVADLPSPNFFQLHPFFIWKPESAIMVRLRNNYILPCLHGCFRSQVVSAGVGRPRVIVGTSGQYYILSSRLCCRACRRDWFADNPRWLEKLPKRFTNLLPAFLTYKKAICKSVMDELRRTGKSPADMANQINELMHLKYERAHLAYLHATESVWDSEAGAHGQRTIGQFLRKENKPQEFRSYEDPHAWCGVSVSSHYLTDCLLDEFRRQHPAISKLLQGTFGHIFRSDHTRKVARKVTLASGVMSSYSIMNENWLIVSWVMVQSETERSLEPMYQGMAKRYSDAGVEKAGYHWVDRDCCAPFKIPDCIPGENLSWDAWKTTPAVVAAATSGPVANSCASRTHYNKNIIVKLDLFHCLRRFSRECTSEHHPLFSTFCQLLSAAFSVVDQADLKRLQDAYKFCGIHPANPTKQHIREHCRIQIPQPTELLNRVEKVLNHFHLATDPNNVPLFKPSMLKAWRIQRVHILRGCLSDPELSEGVMFRYGGTLQLNHVPGEGAKVPIWIPVRGTSQQEGYHFHQAQWITGTHVSTELFQAQGMTGVARWNYQRLVDLKQPGVILPSVFDPALVVELNAASRRVTGQEKYPALHLSERDTGERFGLEYREPGCRPVPLNWDKHKTLRKDEPAALQPPSSVPKPVAAQLQVPAAGPFSSLAPLGVASPAPAPPVTHPFSGALLKQELASEDTQQPTTVMGKLT
ncbi:polycystin 1 [Sarotherodon galilaeus]